MVIGGIFKFNRCEYKEIPTKAHRGMTADVYFPSKLRSYTRYNGCGYKGEEYGTKDPYFGSGKAIRKSDI